MDSSAKSKIAEFMKKPVALIGGVALVLLVLVMVIFGGGDGQDPTAKSLRNLSNQYSATISLINGYSKDVKSAGLKSKLSEASIILTSNQNELNSYILSTSNGTKKVKTTVSDKPSEELVTKLDSAAILNNLDSELKSVVRGEIVSLQSSAQKIAKANPDKQKLIVLVQKFDLNTRTAVSRIDEVR